MNSESRLQKMPKRNLRVLKWLSATPAIGVCTCCTREFKVPLTALTRTADAQTSLQEQFDRHKCERGDSGSGLSGELKSRAALVSAPPSPAQL